MSATVFPKLRGSGVPEHTARAQDSVDIVLRPFAQALSVTPIMGAAAPSWIRPDLLNGYSQTAAPQPLCAYHKDALGYVHTKVALTHVAGTAASTAAFTYALGYRPSETLTFAGSDALGLAMPFTVDAAGNFANLVVLAPADQARLNFTFLAEG